LGLLLSGLVLISSAAAQDTHTIRISDGRVFIDDERVPDEDLPESLATAGLEATFNFYGNDRAFLDLGGHVYMLKERRLVEVDSEQAENGLVVFFTSDDDGAPVRFIKRDNEAVGHFRVRDRSDNTYEFYGDALFDQARKMEELRVRLAEQKATRIRVGEIEPVVVELTAAAENTARMAEALPRIQFQSYLESIGDRDTKLFEELQREQRLELRTRDLAEKIRMSASRDEREELTKELRQELANIFELKQRNRELEIEQLAQRLDALESRLRERQDLQDRIIEARLNELLGQGDW